MSDQHLGELLSAHLDGELTADETATVEAHLADCSSCRDELDATRGVRSKVRDAPPIEAPFGFYERLARPSRSARPSRRVWPALSSVAAIAAAWVAVVGFATTPQRPDVKPPVDELRIELASPDVTGAPAPIQVDKPLINGLHKVDPTATPLPSSVIRLPRSAAFTTKAGNGLVVVFAQGETHVLVFVQHGDTEWSTLQGGLRSPVDGVPGTPWQSTDGNATHALVYENDGTTVVVVGNLPQAQLEQVAREVGKPAITADSFADRVRDGATSVMDAFSLR